MISATDVIIAYERGLLNKNEASFIIREMVNKTLKRRNSQ